MVGWMGLEWVCVCKSLKASPPLTLSSSDVITTVNLECILHVCALPLSSYMYISLQIKARIYFTKNPQIQQPVLLWADWFGLVAKSCPTLCDPVDCSPQGSSIHGILQARILEWVAISFSRRSSPTQGLNQFLLHCRHIIYHLSHQGKPSYHIYIYIYVFLKNW